MSNVGMCIHMYMYIHVCKLCAYMNVYVQAWIILHVFVGVHRGMCVYKCEYLCMCSHVCIGACVCVHASVKNLGSVVSVATTLLPHHEMFSLESQC